MADGKATNLLGMKVKREAAEEEEKIKLQRKRGAMILIMHFFLEHGYLQSLEKFQQESGLNLQKFGIADNMDLFRVMQDFEEYWSVKFGHKPKFYRSNAGGETQASSAGRANKLPCLDRVQGKGKDDNDDDTGDGRRGKKLRQRAASSSAPKNENAEKPPKGPKNNKDDKSPSKGQDGLITGFSCLEARPLTEPSTNAQADMDRRPVKPRQMLAAKGNKTDGNGETNDYFQERLLRPLPDFGYNQELRELAQMIQRDICQANPGVKFSDIAALENCKLLLKEAIIMPIKYPQFFTGLLKPWKGILLFGPPGTGKTMLAKAVATECNTVFFNVSASTIVSKWRGDSEKLVRMLFDLARHHAPSTIFMDEIDAVMSKRSSSGNEHEGSRRMKTELLVQMDGLAKTDDQVFVLAASNIPWDLDPAILRRLEKRIHVHLPTVDAREQMFRKHLAEVTEEGTVDYRRLALRTEGYSGSDIDVVCREAAMRTLRAKMAKLERLDHDNDALQKELVSLDKVVMSDLDKALECTKAATSTIPDAKYAKWESEFGSGVVLDDADDIN